MYLFYKKYPPTSSERRACETTAKPCLPESKPKQQGISPSSPGRPRPPAAQPSMTHACSSQGWMVQDLINYSSIGATARRKRGPQAATGCPSPSPSPPPSPWALKLMLLPARECQITHLTGVQASRHPSIHASGPRGRRQRR